MNLSGRTSCKTVRWKDENTDDILDKKRVHIGSIHQAIEVNFDCQNDMNMSVYSNNII